MKFLLALIIIILGMLLATAFSSCASTTIITSTQQHVITRIDTVNKKHVRISIRPIAPPKSSMGNGLQQGDTIKVLANRIIRYK